MPKTRQAVSIILTRNPEATEVYLIERNPRLKFFGGYVAFPGGTLDLGDGEIDIQHAATAEPTSLPYIVAAAREIFEETGILLCHGPHGLPAEKRKAYRQQLLNDEIGFHDLLKKENLHLDAADFHFIATIVTPEFAPVRYDTQFYWAQIPADQTPEIWPGELVGGDFYTAEAALTSWRKGDMLIVPPVIFMLQELQGRSVKKCVPRIARYAESYRQGAIHQIYFTPGVQMVPLATRTLPPATHTNAYLVGESQLYLIDPGPADPREQQRLWTYLDDRIAEGCTLKAILLTHHHSDHVGAVQACQSRYRLPLYAHRNTADKLPDWHFDRLLEHGETLALGQTPDGQPDWQLEVYHTPGHASGHLAFRESRYGAVIAGDLISTLSTIVISPPDGHMATYLRSLEFVQTIATGALYPGHGPALPTGRQVLQHFIHHRREREQKLLRALTAVPQSTHELLPQVYDDVDRSIWPLAELSLQAGLVKLVEEGACRQVDGGYVAGGNSGA